MFNIVWGIVIEAVVIFFHNSPFIQNWQNFAFDSVMRAQANQPIQRPYPLVLINIDNQTWRDSAWGGGEPKYAPRDKLYALIEHAANNGSRYIIVDILVEGKNTAEDEQFAAQIDTLLSAKQWKPEQHLMFIRSIRTALDTRAANEFRNSALDQVISRHSQQAHHVATYYLPSADHIIRDWELWKIACNTSTTNGTGHWQILPSVQLLIAALDAKLDLSASPLNNHTQHCASNVEQGPEKLAEQQKKSTELNEKMWHWFAPNSNMSDYGHTEEALASRVIYRFNQIQGDAALYSNSPVKDLRALDIINHKTLPTKLNNAITVIGQTFFEAADQHYTPLGKMPGSLLLLNSIDSMLIDEQHSRQAFNVLTAPKLWVTLPIALILIIGVGYAFARLSSISGTLIATMVTIILLAPASYTMFRYGVWLDFAAPVIAIQIHQLIKRIEENIEHQQLTKSNSHNHT